jgi:Na+/proline symporter
MTVVWGLAQMGIAGVAAAKFQESPVVEDALAIASFVTGIILGVFLLGILTTTVDQRSALIGLVAGLLAVSYARFGPELIEPLYPFEGALAWPYFALVGSGTTFLVGVLASRLGRGGSADPSAPAS